MTSKYPGGIISKTAPVTVGPVDGEGGSAPGIWTLTQALELQKQNLWPKPVIPKELWSWGSNTSGYLAQNNTTTTSSPVQVGALTTWSKVTAGNNFCLAIQSDGTLWGWGGDGDGQLGNTAKITRSSPVQVGSLTTWFYVSASSFCTLATKTDGTLWAWGNGGSGSLGLNSTTSFSSPVQVGALTTWYEVAKGANYSSAAIKTDGTLWTWGSGFSGRIGLGDTVARSSPVQVGALTTWYEVTSGYGNMLATTTDGALWTWGRNTYGQLGLNDVADRSSPVQIGALTNWAQASAGGGSFCVAVKTDGTLWSWGRNNQGQLGLNDATNRSSPVQVGALSTWQKAIATSFSCFAIKTDGTLWAWGRNPNGSLGLNNTTYLSSPVQIGSLNTWLRLPNNSFLTAAFAIKTP
jgi:alpha-tubulin suppressor-like RCC1 family protein